MSDRISQPVRPYKPTKPAKPDETISLELHASFKVNDVPTSKKRTRDSKLFRTFNELEQALKSYFDAKIAPYSSMTFEEFKNEDLIKNINLNILFCLEDAKNPKYEEQLGLYEEKQTKYKENLKKYKEDYKKYKEQLALYNKQREEDEKNFLAQKLSKIGI